MKISVKLFSLCIYLCSCVLFYACVDKTQPPVETPEKTTSLPPSPQRTGDAQKGYNYLIYGDYVDGGFPYNLWVTAFGSNTDNLLKRQGDNAMLAPGYTAITTVNNVRVVGANCLSCHSGNINNEFVVGLGNTEFDFTVNQTNNLNLADLVIKNSYGINSPEYQAFAPYNRGFQALGPLSITETKGVNPADKYAAILAAHRNPTDLTWRENDPFGIPKEVIPTDVPAWWLLKKKNVMFFTGIGTGDFARIMMASSLVSLKDSSQARTIDRQFPDILAFIKSLPSPKYKGTIDPTKTQAGKLVYQENCARCHGSNDKDDYPNLLVDVSSIGTDPTLVSTNFGYPAFIEWYNTSWFAKGANAAKLTLQNGYIAPPLDGVWATAPYLHNGSVPTLEDLLSSSQRPKIWKRTFKSDDYDSQKVGWRYSTPATKIDTQTYDTSIKGYNNQGHIYGDKLSVSERANLIEYLKTL
jgi:cytochrome c5